jgi:hypothetical protein
MNAETSDQVFDTKGAGGYVGLSAQTMAGQRCSGVGPKYFLAGMAIRYRKLDLDAWIAARTVTPGASLPPGVRKRRGGPGRLKSKPQASLRRRSRAA